MVHVNNNFIIQYGHIYTNETLGAYGYIYRTITYPIVFPDGYSYITLCNPRNNAEIVSATEMVNTATLKAHIHTFSSVSQYNYGITWISIGY